MIYPDVGAELPILSYVSNGERTAFAIGNVVVMK